MIFLFEILAIIIATLLFANVFARAHVVSNLKNIERYTRMYGNVRDVEAVYIHTIVVFTPMDLIRRFLLRKQDIVWATWNNFVYKKLGKPVTALPPLDYDKIKHEELARLLREFREENF